MILKYVYFYTPNLQNISLHWFRVVVNNLLCRKVMTQFHGGKVYYLRKHMQSDKDLN